MCQRDTFARRCSNVDMPRRLRHEMATLLCIACTLALYATPATPGHGAEKRSAPNVVVILADDLGYGDVQCYNPQRGKIPTPHIDRLAAQGMRFTDAHSSSGVCSPSRYTLLTGRYHWRTRLQAGIVGVFGEPLIAPDRLTIAGLLKQHGYRTAAIGKWHLGWDWPIPQRQSGAVPRQGRWPTATRRRPSNRPSGGKSSRSPSPAGRPRAGSTSTSAPTCPTGRRIVSSRTTAPWASRRRSWPRSCSENNQASKQGPALPGWKLEPILPALGDRAGEFIGARGGEARAVLSLHAADLAAHAAGRDRRVARARAGSGPTPIS